MLTSANQILKLGSFREKVNRFIEDLKYNNSDKSKQRQEHLDTLKDMCMCTNMRLYMTFNDNIDVLLTSDNIVFTDVQYDTDKHEYYIMCEFEDVNNHVHKERVVLYSKNAYYVYMYIDDTVLDKHGETEYNVRYVCYHPEKARWLYVDEYAKELIDNPTVKYKYANQIVMDRRFLSEYTHYKKRFDFIKKCKYNLYRCLHTVDSIIMCIRFPFLYPRNVFTDRHYNNWKLQSYIDKLKDAANSTVTVRYNKDFSNILNIQSSDEHYLNTLAIEEIHDEAIKHRVIGYKVILDDDEYQICKITNGFGKSYPSEYYPVLFNDELYVYHIYAKRWIRLKDYENTKFEYKWSFEYIKEEDKKADDETITENYKPMLSYSKFIWAKIVKCFYNYVLTPLHSIPTYSLYDSLEEGWKRAFGIQMMKEIRHQLIKDKQLFRHRITQIKEKWGGLRYYCDAATKEVYDIINKYENLSFGTCVKCGKPAEYKSTGWICPYCSDCIDKDNIEHYKPIKKSQENS